MLSCSAHKLRPPLVRGGCHEVTEGVVLSRSDHLLRLPLFYKGSCHEVTERDSTVAQRPLTKAPLEVQGAVSRVSTVCCSSKTKAGESVMSKGVRFRTTIANFTERSETAPRSGEGIRLWSWRRKRLKGLIW